MFQRHLANAPAGRGGCLDPAGGEIGSGGAELGLALPAHASSLTIEITQGAGQAVPVAVVPFGWQGTGAAPTPALSGEAGRPEQRVAMTRLRARIAERLVEAQQNSAMLTTFNEIDMSQAMAMRTASDTGKWRLFASLISIGRFAPYRIRRSSG